MLLEFSCSNHKSIRGQITFSALAGKDTLNEELLVPFNSMRVLRSAIIYGANGSGKSNFIDAISFVKNLVMKSINLQPGDAIRQLPHKLESLSTDSTYRVQFVISDVRYVFGFTLNNLLVKEEYLFYYPNGRETKIYERTGEEFVSGSQFKNSFKLCKDALKPNRLLLSCAANFSSVEQIETVFSFFRDDLVIYSSKETDDNWMDYSLHQIYSNPKLKARVIKLMQGFGMGIKDINVKIEEQKLPLDEGVLPNFLSDDFKKHLIQQNFSRVSAKVVYDMFETDLIHEESTGVQKLFAFLCPFIDIIVHGKVLICDELESSLHESLVHGLIELFMSKDIISQAQLFFTTHDTSLLDLDLFRRDQIWFTEQNTADRSTELFSLAEIKNVRKDEKFGRGYISGRYGAIPMLNVNFANIVSDM